MALVRKTTEHTTKTEAQEAADNYLRAYPPQGYDTRATVYRSTKAGWWVMSAERFSSCD